MAGYAAPAAHGLMFHHCRGKGHAPSPGSASAEQVEGILRLVGLERILSPEEWLQRLEGGALSESDLCLSFDDGLLSQAEVALPVLERLGLRAFWFVYSGVFEAGPESGRLELYRRFRVEFFPGVDDFYREFFGRVSRSAFAGPAADPALDARVSRLRADFRFYSENDARFRVLRDDVLGPEAYRRLKEHGVEVTDIIERRYGKTFYFSDPNGIRLQIEVTTQHWPGDLHGDPDPVPSVRKMLGQA